MEHDTPSQRLAAWKATARRLAAGSPAEALAARQGFVLNHEQARRCGLSYADLRRLVRRGRWTAPRRGVVSVLAPNEGGDGPQVEAAALALTRPDKVISHESAAAMIELPLLARPSRPLATVRYGNGGGHHNANVHAAGLDETEIGRWFGVAVTRPARTVVDVARNSGARAGLVLADAALAARLTDPAALAAAVRRACRWPGVRTARRVVDLADARAESPLESLARLMIVDADLPLPELQAWVDTSDGPFRVDGLWRERRVVLEVDGMLKYRSPSDLVAEKRRQEALEQAGYVVVRVTWDDILRHPERTAARIRSALARGGRTDLLPSYQIWA